MTDVAELIETLRNAVRECIDGEPTAAMAYSGGLDSSVIDSLAREVVPVTRYTCAIEGAADHKIAIDGSDDPSTSSEIIVLTEPTIRSLVREASTVLATNNPVIVGYTIPILAVMIESKERLTLTGSFADELFGGYAKYLGEDDPGPRMASDLEKATRESELLRRAALTRGKLIGYPFASSSVIDIASKTPMARKIDRGERKIVLRDVAKQLGVEAYDRPKKAAQYSSGVLKEMERLAKKDGTDMRSWIERLAV